MSPGTLKRPFVAPTTRDPEDRLARQTYAVSPHATLKRASGSKAAPVTPKRMSIETGMMGNGHRRQLLEIVQAFQQFSRDTSEEEVVATF